MNYGRVNSGSERTGVKLQQKTFTPDRFPFDKHAITYDLDGFSEIIINAPDNFLAENIKQGVNIAGVTGTFEGTTTPSTLGTADIKPTAFPTTKNASDDGVDGYSTVTVQAPDNLVAGNIKSGVSIAGVTGTYEGSGGSDPEAEFFKALIRDNTTSNPANAPAGLIKSGYITSWPHSVYVGPDGIDLSNVNTPQGIGTVTIPYLYQYYSGGNGGSSYEAGGPIKFGNEHIDMEHSYLMDLPEGEWKLYVSSFSGCKFVNDIVLKEANVTTGVINGSAFSEIAKFALNDLYTYTSLTLTLPANITAIQGYAGVSGNSSAKLNLIMLATTPPTVESSYTIQNLKSITVPAGSLEAYQTATNWSKFADIMVEATTVTTEGGA